MNPAVLLAVLCGAATVVGIALVVAGALGIQPADHPHRPGRALTFLRGSPRRWLAAVVVTVVVWVLTGWVAVGLAAGFALWGLPALFGAQRRAGREIARVAAMEEWVRRLSDVLVSGVGLGQAVLVAARTAPEPLAAELAALESRINARWPLQSALVSFADDVADPAGDLVATALILADRRRGPGLAAALQSLASALADEVTMRRRVEAERARPRATARAVSLITLVVVSAGLFGSDYLQPYRTASGQLVLVGVMSLFGCSLAWMHAMTRTPPRERLLSGPAPGVAR